MWISSFVQISSIIIFHNYIYHPFQEVVYQERYVTTQDGKYGNGVPDTKYVVEGKEMVIADKGYAYQTYEEVSYPDGNGYVDRPDKKTTLKIKMKWVLLV